MKACCCRDLKEWDETPGYLADTCLSAQDCFIEALDRFEIEH